MRDAQAPRPGLHDSQSLTSGISQPPPRALYSSTTDTSCSRRTVDSPSSARNNDRSDSRTSCTSASSPGVHPTTVMARTQQPSKPNKLTKRNCPIKVLSIKFSVLPQALFRKLLAANTTHHIRTTVGCDPTPGRCAPGDPGPKTPPFFNSSHKSGPIGASIWYLMASCKYNDPHRTSISEYRNLYRARQVVRNQFEATSRTLKVCL